VLDGTVSKTRQDVNAVLLPGITRDAFEPERHRLANCARLQGQ
jgi:hypothetical protein